MQVERDSPSGDESGARVRNAYATYLVQGDSPWKRGLIPHRIVESHGLTIKTTVVQDGHA
jgi:hypothetical protein